MDSPFRELIIAEVHSKILHLKGTTGQTDSISSGSNNSSKSTVFRMELSSELRFTNQLNHSKC